MMRLLPHILIALLLSVVETSFFSSFHGIVRFTPFVFAVSVYLVQHHGIFDASAWMVLQGLFLDILQRSHTPFVTLAYLAAAIISTVSAQHIFSNRSFYGVMMCALLSYTGFTVIDVFLRFTQSLATKQTFDGLMYLQDSGSHYLMLVVFLMILFLFAKRIRRLLVKLFLIPQSYQTL